MTETQVRGPVRFAFAPRPTAEETAAYWASVSTPVTTHSLELAA